MPGSAGNCRFSQPAICFGDHWSASFCATRHRKLRMARQATGLLAQRPLPSSPVGPTGAVGAAAAVTSYLPTDRRRRPCKALCDLPYRLTRRNATRDLLALRKPQRSPSSPARQWGDSSIERQHPVDAALVPPIKRAGDICHTLTALPALPSSALCFGVNHVRAFPSIARLPIRQD